MTHGNLTSFESAVLSRLAGGGGGGRHSFPLGWPLQMGTWPVEHRVFVYLQRISFPVSETYHGPLALPNFQRVIFSLVVFEIGCLRSQPPFGVLHPAILSVRSVQLS